MTALNADESILSIFRERASHPNSDFRLDSDEDRNSNRDTSIATITIGDKSIPLQHLKSLKRSLNGPVVDEFYVGLLAVCNALAQALNVASGQENKSSFRGQHVADAALRIADKAFVGPVSEKVTKGGVKSQRTLISLT